MNAITSPDELVIDNFAGGGGASTGIEKALGRPIDVAINHDPEAIAMHMANHPDTEHLCQSVWKADPRDVVRGRRVGLAWFSPDCKHFSKAKGGKPVARNIRDLAWVVVHWAKLVRPRVIMLENVEEFREWGPLITTEDGKLMPCPVRKGLTFKRWKRELVKLGYKVEDRELRACDYGAPTIRKRLYVIARCDGEPIVWPQESHGPARPKPFRTAAEIIDWNLPCHSIFLSKEQGRAVGVRRPLAPATMARIARGVKRYVLDAADPFIIRVDQTSAAARTGVNPTTVPLRTIDTAGGHAVVTPYVVPITHHGDLRTHAIDEPLRTVTTAHRGEHALVVPALVNTRNGEREGQAPRVRDILDPYATVTAKGSQGALVAAFLAQHNTDMVGHHALEPVSTIVQKGCTQAVVASHLLSLKGAGRRDGRTDAPAPSITAGGYHVAEVRAFLMKYFGTDQDPRLDEPMHTATTKDRFGLVTVSIAGEPYVIADIGMRMLAPRELFSAQGFPASYIINPSYEGKPLTRTAQIRMCGNSVCPDMSEALVKANYAARKAVAA